MIDRVVGQGRAERKSQSFASCLIRHKCIPLLNSLTLVNWGLIWRLDPLVVLDDGGGGQVRGSVQGRLGALDDLSQGSLLASLGDSSLTGANAKLRQRGNVFISAKRKHPCSADMFPSELRFLSHLRQSLLGGDQSSDLLLRVDGKTRVVSPEITSVVRVLCNIVGQGIFGNEGLGLTTNVIFLESDNVFVSDCRKE